MQADTATSEPAAPTDPVTRQRDQIAAEVVSRYAAWSAAAGVIPIPLLDVFAVGGVQLQMLRRLAEVYEVPFSENIGKSLIATLVGSVLPATAASTAAMGVASALKSFPAVGMTLATLSMPALSAGATYAVGKVFIQHFSSGGTLLDFNPQDYRDFMKMQAEKAKAAHATATVAPAPPPAHVRGKPSTAT